MNTSPEQNQILEEGQVVAGKWEILNLIARGGKGEVYQARQLNLDRHVAIKVISREFIESLGDREEEYASELQRFRREVAVMARIRHPNVLQVYDFDQLDVGGGTLDYIVMEYVPGYTLRQTMPEEGLGQDEPAIIRWVERYFFPILKGMEAIHAQGVIHRDMKPENVLIDDGVPKITDFGLAGGHYFGNITRSYHIIGTPPYMPEEQFVDLMTTDARADVYALGKILYEVIEGKMTQERNKPFKTVNLSSPGTKMLRGLDRIVQQATAKDRNTRMSSVKLLQEALTEVLAEAGHRPHDGGDRYRRQIFFLKVAAGVLILLVLAFGLYHLNMETGSEQQESLEKKETREKSMDHYRFNFQTRYPTPLPERSADGTWPSQMVGSDGADLKFVPGGKIRISMDGLENGVQTRSTNTVSVSPFYMQETEVTNHLYVDFLRRTHGLVVTEGAVRRNGQIWVFLGEVRQGYEPIIYENNDFSVRHDAVSKPVVRVTPIGAMAYARFYGMELPSMAQWRRAVQAGGDALTQPAQGGAAGRSALGMMMHHNDAGNIERSSNPGELGLEPVFDVPADKLGIRGLARNVSEWTQFRTQDGGTDFHIHGENGRPGSLESYLVRNPWEAFARVGFRTVLVLQADESGR